MLIQDQEEEGSGEYSDNEPDMDQGNAVYRNDNVESILHTPEEMDQESNKLIEENRINYNELFYNQSPNDREQILPEQEAADPSPEVTGSAAEHANSAAIENTGALNKLQPLFQNPAAQTYNVLMKVKPIENSLSDMTELQASTGSAVEAEEESPEQARVIEQNMGGFKLDSSGFQPETENRGIELEMEAEGPFEEAKVQAEVQQDEEAPQRPSTDATGAAQLTEHLQESPLKSHGSSTFTNATADQLAPLPSLQPAKYSKQAQNYTK